MKATNSVYLDSFGNSRVDLPNKSKVRVSNTATSASKLTMSGASVLGRPMTTDFVVKPAQDPAKLYPDLFK